jgi:serine/threonine-protein kinase RsbW
MSSPPKDSLTLPGRFDQIQAICEFVSAGGRIAGYDEDTLFHLQLATDEACSNVIEHAYGGEGNGDLHVEWFIREDDFVIVIHDHGEPFNPEIVPNPAQPNQDSLGLKVGGLGLYFMRTLMDTVRFQFHGEEGNTLTMTKRLPGRETE